MRDIEAFSYWPDHASAIHGFGGHRRSPDPRYCFHTLYNDVRSGPARYVLKIKGAKASEGEISLRIHAFRPPHDTQISLVAGARLDLSNLDEDEVAVEVPFIALRDVLYAFYGYFSEYSDIQAEHVQVGLIEPDEDSAASYVEPPRSVLAQREVSHEVRPANAMIHGEAAQLTLPVSQDCTWTQLAAMLGKRRGEVQALEQDALAHALAQWREDTCLHALDAYDVVQAGLDGWVLGRTDAVMKQRLDAGHFIMDYRDVPALDATSQEFADFILWPHALDFAPDHEGRWAQVMAVLGHLKIGGMAVIGLTYRFETDLVSSSQAAEHKGLSRNEIGQWVLRLVGSGYSVAPLCFASPQDVVTDEQEMTAFALIVHRL